MNNKSNFYQVINFLLCIYILLLPFEEALAFGGVTALRIVSISIIIVSFMDAGGRIRMKSFMIPLSIWMIFAAVSFLWAISISEAWSFYKIYLIQFLMLLSIFSLPKGSVDMKKISNSFILSGFIASALILVFPTSTITSEGRRTITLFGTDLDPNIVSGIIIIGILFALLAFINSKSNKKILWLVVTGFEMLGTLYTGSRGGLLSLALGIVILVFLYRKAIFKSFKAFIGLLLGLVMILVVINLLPENLITTRFSLDTLFGQTEVNVHSRTMIWSYIPELFVQKPIFGWGAGNFSKAIELVYKYTAGHNMYFIVLIETGIIGFIIYIWFLIKLFIDVKKASIAMIPIVISILACCFFLDGLTDKFFWAMVLVAELSLCNKFDVDNFLFKRQQSITELC